MVYSWFRIHLNTVYSFSVWFRKVPWFHAPPGRREWSAWLASWATRRMAAHLLKSVRIPRCPPLSTTAAQEARPYVYHM